MIHAHPRLAMPPENRFMMSIYLRRAEFGDLRDDENVEAFGEALTAQGTRIMDLGLADARLAFNNNAITATVGPPATDEISLVIGIDPVVHALLLRADTKSTGTSGDPMQWEFASVIQTGSQEMTFSKECAALVALEFTVLNGTN